jgi:hypothetical protein
MHTIIALVALIALITCYLLNLPQFASNANLVYNTRSPFNKLSLKLSKEDKVEYLRMLLAAYLVIIMPSYKHSFKRKKRVNYINACKALMSKRKYT